MSLISQAAKRLKTLLATTAGAAQVGFDAAVNYAAGTVGAMLKSLSASVANLQSQITGILDGATFTGPVVLPGNAAQNLEAVPLQQAMQIAADAAGLAATGVEVGRLLRVERFKVSGTFTKQVGDRLIEAVLIGSGAHGISGGGGGAGATAVKLFNAADIQGVEPVTVGPVITAANIATAPNTEFAGVVAGRGAASTGTRGGEGGTATGGDLNIKGGAGHAGMPSGILSGGVVMYGGGGNSSIGGGAMGAVLSGAHADNGAENTGGGGSGNGSGAAGYVEIRVYS